MVCCQAVFPVDGIAANHTDEMAPADNEADENRPGENESEAGDDEDSEDDDDIQVTIGDIKTTYESVSLSVRKRKFHVFAK